MSDTETDIVQLSKDFLAAQVGELRGNEDPKAFQILRSGDNSLGISLVDIPQDGEEKDLMADYLAAACCVHRAVEVTFASAAWSAMYSSLAPRFKLPSEKDNRIEIVMLVHATSQRVETHTAAILRTNGAVRLSPWIVEDQQGSVANTGRIPEALRMGINLTRQMPPDLVEALLQAKESFHPGQVIELFVKQIRQVRAEVRLAAERN